MRIVQCYWGRRRLPACRTARKGTAIVEFAVICPVFFLIFLGMVEVSRGIMVSGAMANAARIGARAGSVAGGSYASIAASIETALSNAGLPTSATLTVMVNNVVVSNNAAFQSLATPGASISVFISLPYGSFSWLPQGATFFVPNGQPITATCIMTKEA